MKRMLVITILFALLMIGCDEVDPGDEASLLDGEPIGAQDDGQIGNQDEASLRIVNAAGVDICDIAITPSGAGEWSDNILEEILGPGDGLEYAVDEAGSYDFLAVDCDDEVISEEYGVMLASQQVIWRIGEAIEAASSSSAETTGSTVVNPTRAIAQAGEEFQWTECPNDVPASVQVDCGFLTVPENRSKPTSPAIQLAVAIRYAPDGPGSSPPIVYLAGGPGGSALDDFLADPESWDYPFSRDRDLIFVDQRGTGYSTPTLDCPELADATDGSSDNPERNCHARLVSAGIDLTAYNSAENAADIAALRNTLGYPEWNLLGISYGTRLALTIMRDHPQGIRSVVLDSPFPPNADTPVDEALGAMDSLNVLFDDCARDPDCNDAFPDLRGLFLETVARLNDDPIDDFYGDDLVFAITEAINASELIPLLPLAIYEVADGNLDILDELSGDEGSGRHSFQEELDRSDSEGMYNAVICHDEYAFNDYDNVEGQVLGQIPAELEAALLNSVFELYQVCDYWGAGAAAAIENEAVVSDIPTLILVGQYDHATPPKWGRLTAETLSNAWLFEFPGSGHSLLSGVDCAISITDTFLDNPNDEPDSRCIDRMGGPDFEF